MPGDRERTQLQETGELTIEPRVQVLQVSEEATRLAEKVIARALRHRAEQIASGSMGDRQTETPNQIAQEALQAAAPAICKAERERLEAEAEAERRFKLGKDGLWEGMSRTGKDDLTDDDPDPICACPITELVQCRDERNQAAKQEREGIREALLSEDVRRAIADIAADNGDAEDIARLVRDLLADRLSSLQEGGSSMAAPASKAAEERATEREERRLQRSTDEAVGYLFGEPERASDEADDWNFEDFRAEIEAKGVTVSLNLPDGGGHVVEGSYFVEWVWGLIANA